MAKAVETHTHVQLEPRAIDGNPIVVEVTRGSTVESRHRGSAVVVDPDGHVVASWGDPEALVYPRSAIKSVQAIPFVETGAADAFGLGNKEITLACASHNGEPRHVEVVASWLEKIGLEISDLECGTHWPFDREAARALAESGGVPSALHNNCSGKHAAMLSTVRHLSEPTKGYVRIEHPCQQRVMGTLEFMCGLDFAGLPRGIDGCAIPAFAIPLGNTALAMARIAAPEVLPETRAKAVVRIRDAITAEPYMVAGRNRYCSEVLALTGKRVMVKTGAEGVFAAALPDLNLGVALKCDDGATRASQVMMTAILSQLGALEESMVEALAHLLRVPLLNCNGATIGEIRAAGPLAF
jgi:L-asparaginase II